MSSVRISITALAIMLAVAAFTATMLSASAQPQVGAAGINISEMDTAANSATEWFHMGMNLTTQGRYEEAIQAYDKVLEINPRDEEAWNNRGSNLGGLGRYDEALEAFQRAAAINASYAEPWYNIGVILDIKGDFENAVEAYNRATQINPSYQKAWYNKNRDLDIIGIPHTSLYSELTGQE